MGQIIDEKHYEQEDDETRWLFKLTIMSDPEADPSVTVRKKIRTEGGWKLDKTEGVYTRTFDRDGFNEHHYEAFREKWVREPEYREQHYDPETSVHLHFKKEEEARLAGDLEELKNDDGTLPSRHQASNDDDDEDDDGGEFAASGGDDDNPNGGGTGGSDTGEETLDRAGGQTESEYKNPDGSWNRSAIMSRGHEIAKALEASRPYSDRLSEGMTRAWAEAKSADSEPAQEPDVVVDAPAGAWESPDVLPESESNEPTEAARFHSGKVWNEELGGFRDAMTTEQMKEKIEPPSDAVTATYENGEWQIKAEWGGEVFLDKTVRDDFDRLTDVCSETVWPVAAAIRMMKRQAYPEGKSKRELASRVKERVEKMKRRRPPRPQRGESWAKCGRDHDWIFCDEDGKILHVDVYERGGFSAAVRSLRRAGVREEKIEVWIVPGSNWLEDLRGKAPDPGESIHNYDRPLKYNVWEKRRKGEDLPRRPPGRKKRTAPPRPRQQSPAAA